MTREELEHIIGASADVTDQYEFMIIGSQSNAATNLRVGFCLDVVDLFLSKAVAGRDKDRGFCMALMKHRYVTPEQVLGLVASMPLDDAQQRQLRAIIRRWAKAIGDSE